MVDKNLFLHDLAVVAIMKDEEHYVKEWIDYHLLAGADHFYIYDNDSTPEFKKILQPYIDANIVTYTPYPGRARQYEAYNDAFKRFKFDCRYMAFLDADEFLFPKNKPTIAGVVDEVLSTIPTAAALGVNWLGFGSNNLETADFTRGVLDRFIKRAEKPDKHTKAVTNPRRIKFFLNPHFAIYYEGQFSFNEQKKIFFGAFSEPPTADKIVLHHYHFKSREEYNIKIHRGSADGTMGKSAEFFERRNERANSVFDDGIVKYRDARKSALIPAGRGIDAIFASKQINYPRLFNALAQNLFQTTIKWTPPNFFDGKIETFLTCLNVIPHLKDNFIDETAAKFFQEASLNAIHRTLYGKLTMADMLLLLTEMPKILKMKYPAVKNIRDICTQIVPQMMTTLRMMGKWQELNELDNTLNMLKSFN